MEKEQKPAEKKSKTQKRVYSFPKEGKSVEASSLEEAVKKVKGDK